MKKKFKEFAHISFDASIPNKSNICNIGIYDTTNKHKLSKTFYIDKNCSFKAETMALACTLEYAFENGIKILNLFTDNKSLADYGIPKQFLLKFKFKKVTLTWIPRELNVEADKLSKINSICANETEIENNKTIFLKYSFEQKVNLIEKIVNKENKIETELLRLLKTSEKDNYVFSINSNNSMFFSLVFYILKFSRLPSYTKKRIKKTRKHRLLKTLTDEESFKLIKEKLQA